jgi:hypothetical protein
MHDPVIILAPPRSFTSVVTAMLGQHPQMYGLLEVKLFAAETMQERQELGWPRWMDHGLLRVVAQLFAGEQTTQTVALARRWLERRADCTCVSVFRELAEQVNPRRLVDRNHAYKDSSEQLQRARRAFPNAKFIHLLRHPGPQGESLWKLMDKAKLGRASNYSPDPPRTDFQKLWYTAQMNIITFLDGLPEGQWMRIRGEDLLVEPHTYLRKITEWLELRTDEEAIEAMKHPEQWPYARFGPLNAPFGSDPNFLRDPVLRRPSRAKELTLEGPLNWRQDGGGFSPEVKELAREFGYE